MSLSEIKTWLTDSLTDWVTRSPIELSWTAKKDDKYKDDGDNNMMMKQKT